MIFRPWWRARHTTEEAQAALAALEEQDADVQRLGRELARIEAANHFSAMVYQAIRRAREA